MIDLTAEQRQLAKIVNDYASRFPLTENAIDRALTPQHGNIIISVDDELVMRRLLLLPSPALQELNGDGMLTTVAVEQNMPVWGLVSYAMTDLARAGVQSRAEEIKSHSCRALAIHSAINSLHLSCRHLVRSANHPLHSQSYHYLP